MKKVININFHGRVIPIEESAYDMLQQYVEQLRVFFANEEGRDEIINDIEGRIAELFGEVLKKGATCVNDEDVNNIINSMGRPEDFEAEEASVKSQLGGEGRHQSYTQSTSTGSKRLYRDENNKILGGVCSGLANYVGLDPVIMRILFVLFFGVTFIPYLILWILVPSTSSLQIGSQRKRLFRDSDNKMIAGVCSGLAQYFGVQVWIPRILFLIPFLSFVFRWGHWGWFDFPHFLSFSFSPGSVFIYIIFWLVLPEAKSAADKLEMKGEKVDLNNIKSTIQGDLEGFKDRAQQFGAEVKETAQQVGSNVKKNSGGIGRVLVVLLKAFVYFILGSMLFGIVVGLFAIGVVVTGLMPAYSYVLDDGFQKLLTYGTVILFIWVPVIAIVTWIIRRITGKRGARGIITLTFTCLWILGWICFINLIVSIRNDFRYRNNPTEEAVALPNPGINKLEVKAIPFGNYYTSHRFRLEPFSSFDEDTIFVQNIRVRIVKARRDSFEVTMVKMANGDSKERAEELVSRIHYNIQQRDSILMLDKGIAITREEKFRNQQVIVTIAVPVGKQIRIDQKVEGWGGDVHINFDHGDDYWDWENNMDETAYNWHHDVDYVMTATGLERVDKKKDGDEWSDGDDESNDNSALENYKKSKDELERQKAEKMKELEKIEKELQQPDSPAYRYKPAPQAPADKTKSTVKNTNVPADIPTGMTDLLMIKFM